MLPRERRETGAQDLFRSRLDQIINMNHQLVRLAKVVLWEMIEAKREMNRRAAVEPVIGHIKNDHRMDRNYLAGTQGDAINAILAAAGYNFRLLLKWLRLLLRFILAVLIGAFRPEYA